jgi:ribose transport system ATP-binding protein
MTHERADVALVARRITKSFGAVRALDEASLAVLDGEIHGLVGANGSGKSTLIRVLAGCYTPARDAVLRLHGQPVALPQRPGWASRLGMSFVHQDLGLIPSLTVADNLSFSELTARPWRRGSRAGERRRVEALLARHGLDLAPNARVGDISDAERVRLAVVRAIEELRGPRKLLVLDEPLDRVDEAVQRQVWADLRELTASGASVVVVSHDLDGVCRLADRVTVLRDGRTVATATTRTLARSDLVELIGGPPPTTRRIASRAAPAGDVVASVRALSGDAVTDVEIDLHGGEIVGVTGGAGSGYDELPYLLFGARRARAGRLVLGHEYDLTRMTPRRATAAGLALVPGDRLRDGGIAMLSVADNVTMPNPAGGRAWWWCSARHAREQAASVLADHDVRPAEPRWPFRTLSGGNQQKAVLGKWLRTRPLVLLLHEPMQGLDVAARARVASALRVLTDQGGAVLWASADDEELRVGCDRVLVVADGRIRDDLGEPPAARLEIAGRERP